MLNTRTEKILNRLLLAVQFLLSLSGFIAAGVLLGIALRGPIGPLAVGLLGLLLAFFATCVHEGGHWLGARLGGMTILFVHAFAVELQPLRHGYRYRWARTSRRLRVGGLVMAVDRADAPMRRSRLWFIAMGPVMNLLVGIALLPLAFLSGPYVAFVLAFAAINIAMGLANLVPTVRQMPSDGKQLLSWWRKPDEQAPDLAYARILSLSVAGVASADLPAADLEHLDRQPMPAPLVSLSYRLDALQAAGNWAAALQLGEHLEQLVHSAPAAVRAASSSAIAVLRRELAFCRAFHLGSATPLSEPVLNRDVDWYVPTLAPSCRALQAALVGDGVTVERELAQALQIANNAPVLASYPFQLALGAHIRGLLLPPDGRDGPGAGHLPHRPTLPG